MWLVGFLLSRAGLTYFKLQECASTISLRHRVRYAGREGGSAAYVDRGRNNKAYCEFARCPLAFSASCKADHDVSFSVLNNCAFERAIASLHLHIFYLLHMPKERLLLVHFTSHLSPTQRLPACNFQIFRHSASCSILRLARFILLWVC